MRLGGQVLTAALATPGPVLVGILSLFTMFSFDCVYFLLEVSLKSRTIILLGNCWKTANLCDPRSCKAPYQGAHGHFKAEECGIMSCLCFIFCML